MIVTVWVAPAVARAVPIENHVAEPLAPFEHPAGEKPVAPLNFAVVPLIDCVEITDSCVAPAAVGLVLSAAHAEQLPHHLLALTGPLVLKPT